MEDAITKGPCASSVGGTLVVVCGREMDDSLESVNLDSRGDLGEEIWSLRRLVEGRGWLANTLSCKSDSQGDDDLETDLGRGWAEVYRGEADWCLWVPHCNALGGEITHQSRCTIFASAAVPTFTRTEATTAVATCAGMDVVSCVTIIRMASELFRLLVGHQHISGGSDPVSEWRKPTL